MFRNTWKFVLYEDLIFHKLGLEPTISHSLAGLTMAFDSRTRKWSDVVLGEAGIDPALLSKPIPSGEIVGEISTRWQMSWAFPAGRKLSRAGSTRPCRPSVAGSSNRGRARSASGRSSASPRLFQFNDNPALLQYNHPLYCHVIKDQYITIAFCSHGRAAEVVPRYPGSRRGAQGERDKPRRVPHDDRGVARRPRAHPGPAALHRQRNTAAWTRCPEGAFVGMSLGTSRARSSSHARLHTKPG